MAENERTPDCENGAALAVSDVKPVCFTVGLGVGIFAPIVTESGNFGALLLYKSADRAADIVGIALFRAGGSLTGLCFHCMTESIKNISLYVVADLAVVVSNM